MNDLLALLPSDLDRLADRASEYQAAQPFPHISFDDFLPVAVAEAAEREFPGPDADIWQRFERKGLEFLKLACENEKLIPSPIRNILYALNSSTFLAFLEKLTGIDHLIPDPWFHGGGLHQTMPSGHLDIHLDFNFHRKMCVYRRLNLLVYLNRDWKDSYGGQFELRKTKTAEPALSLLPTFNRAALFSTSNCSWHGQPRPVECPAGMSRRSLALYYYTVEPANLDDVEARTTVFAKDRKNTLKRLIPPIVLDAVRAVRRS
ncbi:MAG: 2OG-Fe(II) oxygenase [Solirubrobacterales bacterium]